MSIQCNKTLYEPSDPLQCFTTAKALIVVKNVLCMLPDTESEDDRRNKIHPNQSPLKSLLINANSQWKLILELQSPLSQKQVET